MAKLPAYLMRTPSAGAIQQAESPTGYSSPFDNPEWMPEYAGGPSMPPQGAPPRPQSSPGVSTPTPPAQTDTGPASPAAAPNELPTPAKPDVDKMVERAKNAPADVKKQIKNDKFDFNKAFDQWVEKFGGLVDPKAKMTREEKGLFLMEFGLRMAAAAQDNSAMAAAGIAGVPVVQQIGQRRAQRTAQNMGVLQGAMKGVEAEGLMRRAQMEEELGRERIALEREKLGRLSQNDIIWTDKGGVIIGPDGKPQFLKDDQGNPLMPGLTPGAGTKQYAQQWLYRQLIDVGKLSEQEAIQVVAGAMTPMEVNQRAADLANKEFADLVKGEQRLPPPGSTQAKRIKTWTQEEKDAYIQQRTQQIIQMWNQAGAVRGGGGGGALGGRAGANPDPLGLYGGGQESQ